MGRVDMRRRRYLSALGTTVIPLIGHVGAHQETEDDEVPCPPDDEAVETEGGDPEIQVQDHEIMVEEGFTTETFVEATVENGGRGPSGRIDLEVDWYDADGNYLGDDRASLQTLGPDETWAAQVRHLGGDDDAIADYEFEYEVDDDPPTAADDLVLEESEMRTTEDEVTIEGIIANETGAEVSYIEVIALIYDENCVVLGDEWTNETDVPAGESWAFDMTWLDRYRAEAAAAHRIVMTDSVF